MPIPADENIAIFKDDNEIEWPVGLNLVMVADGLFGICESATIGCQGDLPNGVNSYYQCPGDASVLAGTGFDAIDVNEDCGNTGTMVGGGTGWLEMSGNVEPGEDITVRFAIWDTSGNIYDALVLLDNWRWSIDAAASGVEIP